MRRSVTRTTEPVRISTLSYQRFFFYVYANDLRFRDIFRSLIRLRSQTVRVPFSKRFLSTHYTRATTVRARRFIVVLLFSVHEQFFYTFSEKLKNHNTTVDVRITIRVHALTDNTAEFLSIDVYCFVFVGAKPFSTHKIVVKKKKFFFQLTVVLLLILLLLLLLYDRCCMYKYTFIYIVHARIYDV